MTFAKLVVNALPAGVYGAIVLVLLLSITNPPVAAAAPGARAAAWALLVPIHAASAALTWALLYGGLRYFASHPLHIGWFQLRYATGFFVAHGALLAASCWLTLSRFRRSLAPAAAERLGALCVTLSAAWILVAIVSILPGIRRNARAQWAGSALALLALLGGAPGAGGGADPAHVAAGAARPPAPARRVVLLNFDGADLETVLTLQAAGKLPAFAHLLQEGSYGQLRSLRPCVAPVARASLLTGRLPYRHGVRSGEARRIPPGGVWIDITPVGLQFDRLLAPLLERRERTVDDRETLALHEIVVRAGGAGLASGWAADPDADGPAAPWTGAWPEWLADDGVEPESIGPTDTAVRALIGTIAAARAEDASIAAGIERLVTGAGPGVVALSFPGLDRTAHVFLKHARPRDFGGARDRETAIFGGVLEAHYRRIDGFVARALLAAGPDTVLFVTSTHGMDPVPLAQRLLQGGGPGLRRSGTHEEAPDGFLIVRGPGIEAGRRFGRGSLVDAAPTVLYALGLPAARDFDGRILAGVFTPAWTFDNPVAVIDSYETRR